MFQPVIAKKFFFPLGFFEQPPGGFGTARLGLLFAHRFGPEKYRLFSLLRLTASFGRSWLPHFSMHLQPPNIDKIIIIPGAHDDEPKLN